MNFKVILIAAAVVVAAHAQASDPISTRSFTLNYREPITSIKEKLMAAIQNFKPIESLQVIVDILLSCVLPLIIPSSTGNNKQLDFYVNNVELQKLAKVLEFNPPTLPLVATFNLSDYCGTDGFRMVHDYLIKDDQWADLLKFFYTTGYPEVYQAFIDLYTVSKCPPELINDLPTGPPTTLTLTAPKVQSIAETETNVREEILASQSLQQDPPSPICPLLDILSRLPGSGLLEILDLINTVIHEFQSNPSLHILAGKIQDDNKGVSFRGFRQLPPIRGIISKLHEDMIKDNTWRIIFNFLRNQIGINFYKANFADTILSTFEFFLWGTPFPTPTPSPST